MNLRKRIETPLCLSLSLAVIFAVVGREAKADQKKTTQSSTPPAKPAPPPPKVQPQHSTPPGGNRPPTGGGGTKTTPPPPPRGSRSEKSEGPKGGSFIFKPSPNITPKPLAGGRIQYTDTVSHRTVTTNARGEVQTIEVPGLTGKTVISHGPRGERLVETGRPGARMLSFGPHRGFVERTVRPGYISRTYVIGDRSYAHVYREYHFNGVAYYRYVPAFYYGPRFYAWALTPWGAPIRYAAWSGLFAPPWFGFYGGYFAPYPTYASADLWLTDYVIGQNLSLSYDSQLAGNPEQSATAPPAQQQPSDSKLTPEMKALIADEVRQQLAAEKAAAADSTQTSGQSPTEQIPPALRQKFFVVSTSLDVTTAGNRTCSLTPGDVIQRMSKDVVNSGVPVEVESSKSGDCSADTRATVQLADLQEMHNQFREQIDAGLQKLAEHQAGLPAGPAAETRPVADGTATPLADAESQLVAQQTNATALETQVRQSGSAN